MVFNKKLLLILLILFCFLSVNSNSQSIKTDSSVNSLNKGKWALIFEVGTFIESKNFDSFLFCGKYHFNHVSSIRLGLGFSFNSSTGTFNYPDLSDSLEFPNDMKNTNIKAFLDYVFYVRTSSPVVFFIGGGPTYNYRYSKGYRNFSSYSSSGYSVSSDENVNKTWTAGVHAVIGAEWFVTSRISLVGEYNAGVSAGKSYSTYTSIDKSTWYSNHRYSTSATGDILEFSVNSVKLGVSVYF